MQFYLQRLFGRSVLSVFAGAAMATMAVSSGARSEDPSLPKPILLATFDTNADAVIEGGTLPVMTAASLQRKVLREGEHHDDVRLVPAAGKHGGCLRFERKGEQVLLYQVGRLPIFHENWDATISFWLKLSPDEDLAPGYCDPLQITAKAWNDGAIWVDFDKDLPRAFRMGAFSDYRVWNPADTAWEQVAAADRPLIPVARPPFKRDRWTHVALTIEGVNLADNRPGIARLFLDGQPQGQLERPFRITWTPEDTVLMLGINYVGDFDELAIFDTALKPGAVEKLYRLPRGLSP